ncbi:hypothetical protein [Variovorax saccharolyticus]|uniref:hypothetical protein n=1 Tax=Variovorax saccharolyticus TaxID=3053516 RepID=UPI002574D0CD|nr:hypothetical protein [Variovorax sp. J31P216]MDM0028784.1 hypothetical protein [Variovorax sp. J31P216]
MRSRIPAALFVVALLLSPLMTAAQPAAVPSTTVAFKKGASSAAVQGKLQGPDADARDYVVRAGAGQKMTVEMQTKSTSAYFNVLAPGSEEALYRGEVAGEPRWSGALPASGDYRVRVFLNRAAARQGKSAAYTLKIAVVN